MNGRNNIPDELNGSLYNLLIKNVSRNNPLTSDEAQELRSFRETLTTEQWQYWLQFARNEKNLIKKLKSHRANPNQIKSSAQNPEQLLKALYGLDANMLLGEDILGINKECNQKHEHSEISLIGEENHKLKLLQNSQVNFRQSLENPELKNELSPYPNTQENDALLQHTVDSPKYCTKAEDFSIYGCAKQKEPTSIVQESRIDTGGVSLARGIVVGRRGRSLSVPRTGCTDVVSEPPKTTTNSLHISQNSSSLIHKSHHRQVAVENSIGAEQKGNKSQSIKHVQQNIPTQSIHRGESVGIENLDMSDATEIARSTALRLDSAYSAAQCLISSISTDSLNLCAGLPPTENIALNILSEMLNSMEKSRVALSQLAYTKRSSSSPTQIQSRNQNEYDTDHKGITEVSTENSPQLKEDLNIEKAHRGRSKTLDRCPGGVARWRSEKCDDNLMQLDDIAQVHHSVRDEFDDLQESGRFPYYGANRGNLDEVSKKGSHWYKEATSVATNLSEDTNPTKRLQAQIFNVTDSARRSAIFDQSLKILPQNQLRRFSYSSSGYIWAGMRYSRAQGPVSRVCITHGPPLKAFDNYPVRVDAETGTVDVVWREKRLDDAGTRCWMSSSINKLAQSPTAKSSTFGSAVKDEARTTVLRRERFVFDDIFNGINAVARLSMFAAQRTRKALESGRDLVFLCLGCGNQPNGNISALEPPISTLLGGAGGTGLVSSVVQEVFLFTKPLTAGLHEDSKLYSGSFPTANPSPFIASKVAFEQCSSKVTLSVVILCDNGEIFDLLVGTTDPNTTQASLKKRKSDGKVVLCNASQLVLQSPSDFDRVMGLLLGKRTALQGVLQTLQLQLSQQPVTDVPSTTSEAMRNALSGVDPWAAATFQNSLSTSHELCKSTMLLTVSVTGGAVAHRHTTTDFHFVSPCGRNWSNPGTDVNILAEIIAGLPNVPPQSLLRASPLGMLLMNRPNPTTDFINVVTVNRDSDMEEHGKVQNSKANDEVVHGALNSLRIVAQLTQ